MSKRILAALMVFVMIFSCMPVFAHAEEATPTASGTTYYVSSTNGADGNNGTSESTPFKSLLKINEITLQPGDRVLLERGSVFVDEYLHIQGSGSKEAPIIIDAYGDENLPKPLIQTNGNGVWYQDYGKRLDNINHKYRGNVSSCILLYDVEYIEISNIAMTNEGNYAPGEVYNSKSRIDRTGVAGIAENIGTVDHIYLRNLDVRNIEGNIRNKHMANGGIYLLCHNPDNSATGVSKFDDVLIEGCRVDNVHRWGIAVGYTAYWDQFQYAPTIDANVCQTYGSTNVVIRGNYLTEIGGDGITTMYCYQPLMEYNVLDGYCRDMTDDIYGPSDGGLVAAGIWPWMCKTAIMQYNEVYDSTPNPDGQAWDADWGDNAIYQYNYSSNNSGGAVMFCGQWACNTVFRYNISQNDLAGVLNLANSPNGEIYNNVFYVKEGVKINRTGMSGGKGNKISNNIFYYAGATPADATLGNWGDITAEWNNNIYYNYATTPNDPGAITADPLFVEPGKGPGSAQESGLVHDRSVFEGYKLQDGSPAIDAGMPIDHDLTKDFFGNELDLIPDIGAYDAGNIVGDAERAVLVNLELGENVTLTDLTGDYSDLTPTVDDEKIASVTTSGSTSFSRTLGNAVSTLSDGKYILVNNRAGKPLTNADAAAQEGEAGSMSGLSLTGTKESIADNAVWTLTASGNGYTVQDADGKYLTIVQNDANVSSDESVVSVVYRNNTWTLSQGGAYLNDAANRGVCASGWNGDGMYDASTDSGSLWTIYPVDEKTVSTTELTFTGLFPGSTNIMVGDTLYLVRVSGKLQEVELDPGETAVFNDPSGYYVDADTTSLDANVATVKLSGMPTDEYTLGSAVTSLAGSGTYILVNTRAGKPVTNVPATRNADIGLSLSGAKEDLDKASIWTITATNGGYTIQDLNGRYMFIENDYVVMTDQPTTVNMNYNKTWTIFGNDGAYLNDSGGLGTCASGWLNSSAASDTGSQWEIYEANGIAGENGTRITFTGIGGGETHVLIGDTMYNIAVSGEPHGFENGICDHCGMYEPAELVDGVYQIGNVGQLYWFAQLVDDGKVDADATVTADITVNENVLVDGELNEDGDFRTWYGIGSNANKYTGNFDGQGHTISGLYYDNDSTVGSYQGLFGAIGPNAYIMNVTVSDSYIFGNGEIGGIAGQNFGGFIMGCYNHSYVGGAGSNIGGIVGQNFGGIIGCGNSGTVYGESRNIGGVVGLNTSHGTDPAAKDATVFQCYNTGSVIRDNDTSEAAIGGVVGKNMGSNVIHCYNAGTVSNKGIISSGVVGTADCGTIENCHNVGTASGKAYVGPIVGRAYSSPIVRNCYYLSDTETDSLNGTAAKGAEAFTSGEITDLLNGSAEPPFWMQGNEYPIFSGICSHIAGEPVIENTHDATCTEDGSYDSVIYCTECRLMISRETITIPALGHTEQTLAAVDPTCTETGLTEGTKCSVCDEVLTAQVEIPAQGHDFVNGDCSRCDAEMDPPFEDVPVGEFYFDPVYWAVENGITTGATETLYNPGGDLLRAQFVTFLWRAAGSPKAENAENPFKDVKPSDFFYDAVLWAVENKITNGISDTEFGAYNVTNRAQAVTFLWRYKGEPTSNTVSDFSDVVAGEWYASAINWAVENKITNGMGDGTFGIGGICNRAQAVTFLYRAIA